MLERVRRRSLRERRPISPRNNWIKDFTSRRRIMRVV